MAETETEGDSTTELAQLKALLSQTTVTEDKILKDYKAYKDGQLITGTMENYAGTTQDATATSDDTYTYLSIPNNGYYTTDSKLRMEHGNLGSDKLTLISNFALGGAGVGVTKSINANGDILVILSAARDDKTPYGGLTSNSGTVTALTTFSDTGYLYGTLFVYLIEDVNNPTITINTNKDTGILSVFSIN